MHKFLVADDHPLYREALKGAVLAAYGAGEVFEAASLVEALRQARRHDAFELILLDLDMPGMNGFAGLVQLQNASPLSPLVVVSAHQAETHAGEAAAFGALGYLPKLLARAEMIAAIRTIRDGGTWFPAAAAANEDQRGLIARIRTLTPQQRKVLELLAIGRCNKEICGDLGISETTVKAHVSAVLQKLNVTSRTQAAILGGKVQFGQLGD